MNEWAGAHADGRGSAGLGGRVEWGGGELRDPSRERVSIGPEWVALVKLGWIMAPMFYTEFCLSPKKTAGSADVFRGYFGEVGVVNCHPREDAILSEDGSPRSPRRPSPALARRAALGGCGQRGAPCPRRLPLRRGGGAGPRTSGLLSRAAAQWSIRFQTGRLQALETWGAEFNASMALANAEVDSLPSSAEVITVSPTFSATHSTHTDGLVGSVHQAYALP